MSLLFKYAVNMGGSSLGGAMAGHAALGGVVGGVHGYASGEGTFSGIGKGLMLGAAGGAAGKHMGSAFVQNYNKRLAHGTAQLADFSKVGNFNSPDEIMEWTSDLLASQRFIDKMQGGGFLGDMMSGASDWSGRHYIDDSLVKKMDDFGVNLKATFGAASTVDPIFKAQTKSFVRQDSAALAKNLNMSKDDADTLMKAVWSGAQQSYKTKFATNKFSSTAAGAF